MALLNIAIQAFFVIVAVASLWSIYDSIASNWQQIKDTINGR